MMGLLIILPIGIGIIIAVALFFYWILYNGLIGKKNQVENMFASVDSILQKRYDLIPNLVSSVKEYMTHERETLTGVTEMRAKAMQGNLSDDEKVSLDNQMSKAVGHIMVAVEAYPELKASENFQMLQRSLNEVEEQLSAGRRAYNAAVTDFNNSVEMFPSNIVAGIHHYQPKKWFETVEAAREAVNVSELFE